MQQSFIPYAKHSISPEDIAAVHEALSSSHITRGPLVEKFEESLAKYCNAKYAVVVSSGTAALHLAYKVLGVQDGDRVITSPITFASTMNTAVHCGATPDFVDIDAETYAMDMDKLEAYLQELPEKELPKVVTGVSFTGLVYDMERLWELSEKYGFKVLADQCHAMGGYWLDSNDQDNFIGNCRYADCEVISFHATKNLTTGEGGAILTNDPEQYQQLIELRNHGITRDTERMQVDDKPWFYEVQALGFNYQMTEFQAALGLRQLQSLQDKLQKRQQIFSTYQALFKQEDPITLPKESANVQHACHLYVIQVPDRDHLYSHLHEWNIGSQVHYIPVHLHPLYQEEYGFKEGDYPVAEEYFNHALTLPLYPELDNYQLEYIANKTIQAVNQSTP